MAHQETFEKKPKKRSKAGIVLLILLALIIGGAGYLYYSAVKAPLELDNPQRLVASAPMPAEERFCFSAADRTVQVKMDKTDIWSLILTHVGEDFLDSINRELSSYSLSVSGCAIRIEEAGLCLDLELFYKDIRLVAKVPCELEITGAQISLSPTGVKLGALSLPVGGLLSSLELEYDLTLPVITQVTQVTLAQDAILVTGPMEADIHALAPLDKELYQTAVFWESLQPLTDALQTQEGYAAIASHLERNPGDAEELYRGLFILADPETVTDYLDSRHGLTQRFFPGIDFSDVTQAHTAMTESCSGQMHVLEQFFTNLVNDYNEKKFRLSKGEFLLNYRPFQVAQYAAGKYDSLFECLDPESFFLILVDAEDGFVRKTSSFYRMADESQQFTQPVDFNKTYILGCVFRSVDGNPFLLYETEIQQGNTYSRNIKLQPLTEAEVAALQVPETFGVWTG